ncbi:hypothetical protein GBO58_03420 [Pediococcus acidilactici]|nr:hypothetical protein GBO58_03420 [Pediococcus acidilactici]KAF0383522.1 hypothetical protein GBO62_01830 [Pediococcus acidilactici]KAF0457506.1 hypothetical protein GBP02_01830 [Pediococcus acidilactici]KAF0477059.1 hypothetical protein GBP10_03630 [Pediococcus acidilactici]KAF0537584.1 hypothetical protein GBP37_03640 [Pediococcus acidilactici]
MPPVMFSVVTKYHKGRHSLFLYNSEIFYAFTQDILRSHFFTFNQHIRYFFFMFKSTYVEIVILLE